jgi:hypothetical protein
MFVWVGPTATPRPVLRGLLPRLNDSNLEHHGGSRSRISSVPLSSAAAFLNQMPDHTEPPSLGGRQAELFRHRPPMYRSSNCPCRGISRRPAEEYSPLWLPARTPFAPLVVPASLPSPQCKLPVRCVAFYYLRPAILRPGISAASLVDETTRILPGLPISTRTGLSKYLFSMAGLNSAVAIRFLPSSA